MAARKYLIPIDLNQNEIQNVTLQNLATFPGSPTAGQIVFRTSDDIPYVWDGTAWGSLFGGGVESVTAGTGITVNNTDPANPVVANDGVLTVVAGTNITVNATDPNNPIVSATATGGQVDSVTAANGTITIAGTAVDPTVAVTPAGLDHTFIADFDTQVRTSTLNQMTAPTADLSINTHKLTNVVDPTSAQDAATKAYVDSEVSAGVQSYAESIGDNASTSIVVTHSLGTKDITVSVRDTTTDAHVMCDVDSTSTTTATFTFTVAPTTDQYRVVIQG